MWKEYTFHSKEEKLEKAKSTGRPVLLLHSDQGVQYSSAGYHPCSKNTVLFRACQGSVRYVTMLSWKTSLPDSKSFCVLIFAIGYVMIYPPLLLRLSIISTISVPCVSSAKSRLSPFDWNRRLNSPAFFVYYLLTTSVFCRPVFYAIIILKS